MAKYILLDNVDFITYYLRYLKSKYIPIALNLRVKALLESRGIEHIDLFDNLSFGEVKGLTRQSFAFASGLLKEVDKNNRQNYFKLFGISEINLTATTIKYLFTRFVIGTAWFLKSLERILEKYRVEELAYLHNGVPLNICGTRKERGFLYPDNIIWEILDKWQHKLKPKTVLIKGRKGALKYNNRNIDLKNRLSVLISKTRIFLHPWKKAILRLGAKEQAYSEGKKSLLLLGPLYDLTIGINNLSKSYNIIRWDSDGDYLPREIKEILVTASGPLPELNFCADGFNNDMFFGELNLKEISLNLIRRVYAEKLSDMLRYWQQARAIHEKYNIDLVLWNNPPHRYPDGVVKEFFQLKNIAIFGMQHGGLNGSNDIGETFSDLELNSCDYYFSYGFEEDDLRLEKDRFSCRKVLPVGSLKLKNFSDTYLRNSKKGKKKIDILFPIAIIIDELFFTSEVNNPRLFELQKKIIELLAKHKDKKILLKFPVGGLAQSALGVYVENKYPGVFMMIDHISLTKCLEEYEPNTIIIEEQSTPLNETVLTKSNIIVYNNLEWYSLTDEAFRLLSKRAIICNGESEFLNKIEDCLKGHIQKKDISSTGFAEKYCIYKGSVMENLEKAMINMLGNRRKSKED